MNKPKLLNLLLSGFVLFTLSVFAEDQVTEPEFINVPQPPILPDPVVSGEVLEPEITIIQREDTIITEYRLNGHLYKAKVSPAVGPPYYLVDRDGDGNLETRVNDIYQDIVVPQWVLFAW